MYARITKLFYNAFLKNVLENTFMINLASPAVLKDTRVYHLVPKNLTDANLAVEICAKKWEFLTIYLMKILTAHRKE